MSAQPCGCDPEAAWICKQHLDERATERARLGGSFIRQAIEAAQVPVPPYRATDLPNVQRFIQRLADADTMRDTTPIDTPAVRIVTAAVNLLAERKRIADVLAAFYRAPLSMSSVQPILALALELNSDLVERQR